ncbi:MAG TPA: hypothetical protein VG820_02135 [Fimbriimonadaceae bacterium]|nr:hypothetical protein [Fimbriimonadaceae bacterium]
MKHLAVLVILAGMSALAKADYSPTSVSWRGWNAETSEYLCAGKLDRRYTIMNLFDSNPATTWVLNRTADKHELPAIFRKNEFSVEPNDGIKQVDGFRIMNGYNKSRRLYDLNDAVSELRIYAGKRLLKTVQLGNWLGWHNVRLPVTQIGVTEDGFDEGLTFEVVGVRKGRVHDLCISGLQLTFHGKSLTWSPDRLVLFNSGGETEPNDTELWTWTGRYVVTDRGNNIMGPTCSPNGRFIVGTDCPDHSISLWVADCDSGRIIHRRRMFDEPNPESPHIYHESASWIDNRTVDIRFEVNSDSDQTQHVTRRLRF